MKYSVKEVYFRNEISEGTNWNSLGTRHQPEPSDRERWRSTLFAHTVDISFFLSSFLLTHFLEMHILCIMGDVKWIGWWILPSKNLKGYELSILIMRVQRRWNDFWLRLIWESVWNWVWRKANSSFPVAEAYRAWRKSSRKLWLKSSVGSDAKSPSMKSKEFWPHFVSQGPICFLTKYLLSVKK